MNRIYPFIFMLFVNIVSAQITSIDSALYETFDFYEPFDYLQDWTGSGYGDRVYDGTNSSEFPHKLDGSMSEWEYYSNWSDDYSQTWIGAHADTGVWRGTKSLMLDYGGESTAYGPSRLGIYFGDSIPNSGYRTIHIFYLIKHPKSFFSWTGNDVNYFGYYKLMSVSSGFRDIWHWGTQAQYDSTADVVQYRHVYGLNFVIPNIFNDNYTATGNNLITKILPHYSHPTNNPWTYEYQPEIRQQDILLKDHIANSEWLAIEFAWTLSSPGSSNGVWVTKVYDASGQLLCSEIENNIIPLENPPNGDVSNHLINKIEFGGNRYEPDFPNTAGYVYIDDIIIDKNPIAYKYFSIIFGNNRTPEPVKNFRIKK